jgi:hypothetical protein
MADDFCTGLQHVRVSKLTEHSLTSGKVLSPSSEKKTCAEYFNGQLEEGMEKETDKERKKVKSLCLTKHHAMKTYWGVEV